jgi:hypothetical protein
MHPPLHLAETLLIYYSYEVQYLILNGLLDGRWFVILSTTRLYQLLISANYSYLPRCSVAKRLEGFYAQQRLSRCKWLSQEGILARGLGYQPVLGYLFASN